MDANKNNDGDAVLEHPARKFWPESVAKGLIILPDLVAERRAVALLEKQQRSAWQKKYYHKVRTKRKPRPPNAEHEKMKALVNEWRAMGKQPFGELTRFCDKHGVGYRRFYRWLWVAKKSAKKTEGAPS